MNVPVFEPKAAATPLIFSASFKRSCRFYSDGLGCAVYKEDGGLRVRSEALDLKICRCRDKQPLPGLAVVCPVSDVARLYQTCLAKAHIPISRLKCQPSGTLQFSLTDPDRNTLYFVEQLV